MIPVSEPLLTDRELQYVSDCIRSGWISSSGRAIDEFEQKWAEYCGVEHGVSVCNGTAALQLAVAALRLSEDDEVILPTFTIISCATAVVLGGATPVLVDVDPRTLTMDVEQIAAKITPRTKAIMVVHMYGHPADMDPITALAEQHDLAIIEDAAQAHGAEYLTGRESDSPKWKRCGSFGTASCFSFYANKLITTGEGGMVVTDDADLARRLRSMRNLCFEKERRFFHSELGYNFRFTNMQAAMGLAQFERIDELVQKKQWIGREYTKRLEAVNGIELPVEESWAHSTYWMYGLVLSDESGMDAAVFAEKLKANGIDSRPYFLGMHEQPAFLKRGLFADERYPVAEHLSRRGLYIPSGLTLTEEQLDEVVRAISEIMS